MLKKPWLKRGLIALTLVLVGSGMYSIGFNRLSPEDCTSVERYEALTGSCYYDCDTDQDCAEKARKVDAELAAFFEGSKTRIASEGHSQEPKSQQIAVNGLLDADYTGTETKGTIYTVDDQLQLQPKPANKDQQLWTLFKAVAGNQDIQKYVQSFEVFNDENNTTAASVWQSQEPGKWHVNVNEAFSADKKDLIHTMIHEYGHIVSLNNSQVEKVEGACPRLEISEGCVIDAAYVKAFKDTFWSAYGDAAPVEDADPEAVSEFYNQQPDAFVSEYAATNYIEDLAESWAIFVTKARPGGGAEKDRKVQFFYNYKELVETRERIRQALARSL